MTRPHQTNPMAANVFMATAAASAIWLCASTMAPSTAHADDGAKPAPQSDRVEYMPPRDGHDHSHDAGDHDLDGHDEDGRRYGPPPRRDAGKPGGRPGGEAGEFSDGPSGERRDGIRERMGSFHESRDQRTGGRRDDGGKGPGQFFSDEDMETAMEIVREYDTDLADRIEATRESDPNRARFVVFRYAPWLPRMLYTKLNDPALYTLRMQDMKLDRSTRELAMQVLAADERQDKAEAQKLRDELRLLISDHFDLRRQIRERDLERLAERLEQLREKLKERGERAAELKANRLAELVGASEDRSW